jgi:hypothetical protein
VRQALPASEIDRALRLLCQARIVLAAADRPADILPLIGWTGRPGKEQAARKDAAP